METEAQSYRVPLPIEGLDLKDFIDKIEKDFLIQAIERTKGNKQKASRLLRINRTTLIAKLKSKGLFKKASE